MSVKLTQLYEYDPTGTKSDNRIVNESVSVNPPTSIQDHSYFIPRATPFFADSMVVRDGKGPGARTLVENVDYWCVIDFVSASVALKKRICAGIALLDSGYNGTLYITYQTLGGNFSLDDKSVMEELVRRRYTSIHISYEQIINLPAGFAPALHEHNVKDMIGFGSVVTSLNGIKEALEAKPGSFGALAQTLHAHLYAKHAHTKAQVGLENVANYGIASDADILAGAGDKYVVASHLKQYMNKGTGNTPGGKVDSTELEAHLRSQTAHEKSQVGLGNVENYGVANLDDIRAGADKYITANVLKQFAETDFMHLLYDDLVALTAQAIRPFQAEIENSQLLIADLTKEVEGLKATIARMTGNTPVTTPTTNPTTTIANPGESPFIAVFVPNDLQVMFWNDGFTNISATAEIRLPNGQPADVNVVRNTMRLESLTWSFDFYQNDRIVKNFNTSRVFSTATFPKVRSGNPIQNNLPDITTWLPNITKLVITVSSPSVRLSRYEYFGPFDIHTKI